MPDPKQLVARAPIDRRIFLIRGQKVMLDRDLAVLYQVETFNLNKAVRRNIERFPENFAFVLTRQEVANLKFQIGISSWGGRRKPPYAFTEHGVAMLSSVLKSKRAVQMSIAIINAFVRLREMIAANKDLAERMEKLEASHAECASVINVIVEEIKSMKALPAPAKKRIGFHADRA